MNSRSAWLVAALVVMAAAIGLRPWLENRRPPPPEERAARRLVVTSSADFGPGSLREALFAANSASGRALIEMEVGQIRVETPLPPLVNPEGIVLRGLSSAGTELLGQGDGSEPLIKIQAPRSRLRGIGVRGAVTGIMVLADGAQLIGVTAIDCDVGVLVGEGLEAVEISDSTFRGNAIGVRVAGRSDGVTVRESRFEDHDRAGLWAAASGGDTPLAIPGPRIHDNDLENDRIGVVLVALSGIVEGNRIVGAREAGIYLTGNAGRTAENRIRSGQGVGMMVDDVRQAVITRNEIDHNVAVGILVRGGSGVVVDDNRLYENGYGIVTVFGEPGGPHRIVDNQILAHRFDGLYVVAGSPIVTDNESLRNRAAGLRLVDFERLSGEVVSAEPLLRDNRLEGNGAGASVRERLRESPATNETASGSGEGGT